MEKVKSFLRKLNCFSSSTSQDIDVDVDQHAKIRSPTPSPSRETLSSTSIVLAHGAFHTSWHYQLFTDSIRKHTNIDRVVVPQQTSCGSTPPQDSFHTDVQLLHASVASELSQGRDVLLVCHSYGAIPGCEALADLPQQQPGITGRVLGIVFVSAFVAEAGQNLVSSKMAGRASWVRVEGALSYVNDPISTFYNAVSSPELVKEMVDRLIPQASVSFMTTTKHETWKSYPCYYVRCLNDQAMCVEEQNYFIDRLERFCPGTKVKEIASDHAPFASMPDRVAEMTEEIVMELRGSTR
ncbi:Putative alpha/beta hydrolase-1 [Septoria linicola]|uniref:Alpha/beta hydrolase-1 n=1 Tax=Septoria linicola TaxID=215465 RepID=A0A9Q9AW29_9PEZI|nr:Putative alpha/beta hydrolase-1 [Septoria linicola]